MGKTKKRVKQFIQGQVNAVDSAMNAVKNGVKAVHEGIIVATQPGLINKVRAAKRGASNVKEALGDVGKAVYESGKSILNDRKQYTRYTNITPAANTTRPMNPSQITSITNDPTMGGVVKVSDIYYKWTGFNESKSFDLIVFNYFEQIRNSLKSNLPYTQTNLKAYFIDAIALRLMGVYLKKSLQFRSYSIPDSPTIYQLFRKLPNTLAGYGATSLYDVEFLKDENISSSIANYDIAARIADDLVLIPKRLNDFIDHYFGLVFAMDKDNYNKQVMNPIVAEVEYANYNSNDDTITITTYNFNDITPDTFLNLLTTFASKYGMIAADIKKSQSGLSANHLPQFSEMKAEIYYDPTFIQALINSYTDDESVQGNNYIRLDYYTENGQLLEDDLTTYLFLGAMQSNSTSEFMNIPLITCEACCMKIINNPNLNWELGFTQGGNVQVYSQDYFGIMVSSSIYADVYINAINGSSISINTNNQQLADNVTEISGVLAVTPSQSTTMGTFYLNVASGTKLQKGSTYYMYVPLLQFLNSSSSISTSDIGVTEYDICVELVCENFGSAFIEARFKPTGNVVAIPSDSYFNTSTTPVYIFNTKQSTSVTCSITNMEISQSEAVMQFPALQNDINKYNTNNFGPIAIVMNLSPNAGSPTFSLSQSYSEGQYFVAATPFDTLLSYTNVVGTTSEVSQNIGTDSGYLGLAEFYVEQMDHHIPIRSIHRLNYKFSTDSEYTSIVQSSNLLKESYVPYFYQLDDLLPVAYQMMYSLLNPDVTTSRLGYKSKK